MLQWMGGSRKKVTTSRKSIQKRQKQYFEQRKRQQQTTGFDNYDDETNKTEKHPKERRSLDVMSLLNLSKISQECTSACPSGRNDLGVNVSKVQFDASNGSLPVQSGTVVQPFDLHQFKEARIPSAFQMETASPKKNYCYSHNGHTTKLDQWVTTNEQPLSVLDLLSDDGLNTNMEGNSEYEDHVAFSVQGLGRVGAKTPVHSPQQPTSRAFAYGFSSPNKAPGKLNLSKKFNSLLDDLDSEDARMQDINIPINSNHLDFSSDYMDLLSNPNQKSFTLRDSRQYHGRSSKKNHYFDRQSEDKWEDRSHLEYDSFFDEPNHDLSWKTRKSSMDDIMAENLTYRSYDTPDFSFDGPQISTRAAEKVTDKFDILGSTSPFSKHETSEYGCDFLVSNWSRHPTVERKYDHKVTNKPEHFTAVKEDARENSSLQSEESCSSTAVKYQATDDSISNATSRHCRRRGNDTVFAISRDKHNMKALAKESNNDCQPKNIVASGSAARTNMPDLSDLKPHHRSTSFFQENLEPKGNWFSEERFTGVDINPPSSRSKQTGFDSDLWDEDPYCKSPAPKSQIGANHQRSGFHYEAVANSPSGCFTPEKIPVQDYSPMWSKPEPPLDSRFTAGYQNETLSHDTSAQESIAKDVEFHVKIKPSSSKTFHPGEEVFVRDECVVSEAKVAADASNSTCNDHEAKELTTAFLPDLVGDTSPSTKITTKSGTEDCEKEFVSPRNGDRHTAYKSPCSYQSGKKENENDFGPKERMGYKQKSDYFDSPGQAMILQSYVFQLFCVQRRLQY